MDVTSFDSSGNYVLSGTPSSYPVALIYWLKISAADYPNLDINNIIEENIPLLVDNIYTSDGTLTGDRTVIMNGNELILEGTHSFNYDLKITDLAITLPSNSATLSSTFSRAVDGAILSMRNNSNVENVLMRSYASGGVQGHFTAGKIGIGTTTPTGYLHVENTATTGVGAIIENSDVANTGDIAQFQNSTGTVASITNDGYITAQAATGTSDTVAIWDGTTLKKKELKNQTILSGSPFDLALPSNTEYISISGGNTFTVSENTRYWIAPKNGVLSDFYINTITTQGVDGDCVLTIRKNGVGSSLILTITAGQVAGTLSNTSDNVTVSAGDLITIQAANASASSSARIVSTSIIFTFD